MATTTYILNLHGIGIAKREVLPAEQRVWLDESRFSDILNFLQSQPNVLLTFDDANESDCIIALPALENRGLKARFFLVADRIGRPGFLSSEQVQSLLSAGMKIGNHGMKHRRWTGLSDAALKEELIEAKGRLEQLTGAEIEEAACPFGSYNRRVIRFLRQAGYKSVYTSDGGPAKSGSFILPRNSLGQAHNPESVKAMLTEEPTSVQRFKRQLKRLLKRWC